MNLRGGWKRCLAAITLLAAALPALAAVDEEDLLPVDEAFVLSARAVAPGEVRIDWKIADGYYLYRHRMGARVAQGFNARPLQLPAGRPHVDEFFGEVETYRERVSATLAGTPAPGVQALQLEVKYQGCADIGICYPPQTRTLTVRLPAAATQASPLAGLGRPGAGAADVPLPGIGGGQARGVPLPAEQAFVFEAIAGDGDTILMRFTPARGYYLYRDRSSFTLSGHDGLHAGTPRWPQGRQHHDEYFGDVVVYFDQIDVPLPLRRSVADAARVELTATFQGCQDEGICYPPMTRTVQVALPAGTLDTPAPAPAEMGSGTSFPSVGTDAAESPAGNVPDTISDPDGADAVASPGENVPDTISDSARSLPPARTLSAGTVLAALALALLGGLVLNLMPCVLPILSLKVLGVAQSGGSRASARSHALWYTAGVLAAFVAIGALVLALRAGGQALGWGFQLQQPWVLAALVYLMFAVGLSLSGVFTVGSRLGNLGHGLASRSGPVGDFFTGVLACVVASPCIAPFMGGALAVAFTAPAALALAVFVMLGLGLALPFLLVGLVPALADRLPRPGAWMETLKQVLAFPMYLTALWLLWVFGRQLGPSAMALALAGLLLLAFGLWWFERSRWKGGWLQRGLALALIAASLLPAMHAVRQGPTATAIAPAGSGESIAYSADALARLRASGELVFVNMTADWCVTCKANERRVLSQPPFREALAAAGGHYMVGDWTSVDPEIGRFLESHGAVGVPLYVIYPRGGGEGEVLPVLLGEQAVLAAIERAR